MSTSYYIEKEAMFYPAFLCLYIYLFTLFLLYIENFFSRLLNYLFIYLLISKFACLIFLIYLFS